MHVLFIPKWYPGRNDPQLGDFLRKQAEAAGAFVTMTVLVIEAVQDNELEQTVDDTGTIWELRVPYRASKLPFGPLRKAINLRRFLRASEIGRKRIWAERGKPDLSHAYIMARPALIAYRLKSNFGIPYVIGEQSSEYLDGTVERKSALYKAISKFFFRQANGVHAVSKWLGDHMVELGFISNYTVIPNVVPGLERTLPVKGTPGHFLMVADLVDRTKNVSGVIRALKIARESDPTLRLDVIGDGPDRKHLERLTTDQQLDGHVKFLGRLPNTGVLERMGKVGAVIINSRVETFSVVTGEALAQGRPVIATRCGGPVAFVQPENGILIDVDDEAALVKAMLSIASDAGRYDPAEIRAGLSEQYSPKAVGEQMAAFYQRALHHGG